MPSIAEEDVDGETAGLLAAVGISSDFRRVGLKLKQEMLFKKMFSFSTQVRQHAEMQQGTAELISQDICL